MNASIDLLVYKLYCMDISNITVSSEHRTVSGSVNIKMERNPAYVCIEKKKNKLMLACNPCMYVMNVPNIYVSTTSILFNCKTT